MEDTYVVLRKPRRPYDPFRGVLNDGVRGDEGSLPEVELVSGKDAADARGDETVEIMAPAMGIRQIRATDGETEEPDDDHTVTWGVRAVGAHESPCNGKGAVVAVLDSGIDAEHPAFSGVELIQRNFTNEEDGDKNGHGTHCAGTIFGRDVSGRRIGVAPGVERALIGKVTDRLGSGSTGQVIKAIHWAAEHGAHIISMSLSIDFAGFARNLHERRDFPMELATSKALVSYGENLLLFDRLAALLKAQPGSKPVLVAAAGNESRRHDRPDFEIAVGPPAATEGVVAVGALERIKYGRLGVYRSSNTRVDVAAPGAGILSAEPGGGLTRKNGTSMAGPHVAGVAALWVERLKTMGLLSYGKLYAQVVHAATREGLDPDVDPLAVGAGLVQAPSRSV